MQVIYLPVDPEQGECEGSKEEVNSEERNKLDLPLVLRDHSIKQNVVLCNRVEKGTEREENTNNTEPD